jgi:hypothetical protein
VVHRCLYFPELHPVVVRFVSTRSQILGLRHGAPAVG